MRPVGPPLGQRGWGSGRFNKLVGTPNLALSSNSAAFGPRSRRTGSVKATSERVAEEETFSHEAEIREAVRHMISRYGDSALQEINLRIYELRERGELDAVETWIKIRETVRATLQKGSQGRN